MCGVSCIRSTAGYCICTNELRFYHPPLHRKSRGRRHEEHSSRSWVVGLSNASFHLVHTVCQYWCKGEECDAFAGKKGYGPTHALCAISKLCNRRLSRIARPSTTFPSHRRCVHQHPVRSETCVHTTSPHRASGTTAPMGPHMLAVQPPTYLQVVNRAPFLELLGLHTTSHLCRPAYIAPPRRKKWRRGEFFRKMAQFKTWRLHTNHVRAHGGCGTMQYVRRCGVLTYLTLQVVRHPHLLALVACRSRRLC